MTETMYERLGGEAGIAALVDAFYDRMAEPDFAALRALHAPDLAATRAVLKLYLAEWTGGPADYSAANGHPRLRRRHMHIRIGEAERDDWMRCMGAAMATITDREAARLLQEKFAGLADWMRNQPGNPHDAGHVVNSTVENTTNIAGGG